MPLRPSLLTCILVLALAIGCPQPQTTETVADESADSNVVARVDGETVTEAEVDTWIKQQLFDQATKKGDPMKLYELRSRGLDDLIDDRLLKKEAVPLGITAEELVAQEAKQRATVPEEEVLAFYEENKDRLGEVSFEDVAPRIRMHLQQQSESAAAREYVAEVRDAASVEIYLDAPRVEVAARGPSKGPEDAPVTIVEFSDYRCGYCKRAEPVMRQLLEKYPTELRLVARSFPLNPVSRVAAEAAACANEQGRFWDFHSRLFSPVGAQFDAESLQQYASDLEMDTEAFQACVDERRFQDEVEADLAEGRAAGVTGTPAFFVNGIRIKGARPLEEFVALIEKELERAGS
jgi:protein-disulfide isomerase